MNSFLWSHDSLERPMGKFPSRALAGCESRSLDRSSALLACVLKIEVAAEAIDIHG